MLTVLHKLGADFTIPNDKKQTALSIWPEGCESAKPLAVAKAANVSTPPTTNGNEIKAVSELSDINLKDAINAENLKAIQQWGAENKTRFLGQIEGFSPITYALQGDKPKLGCAIAMLAALEAKDIVNDQVQLNSIRAFINSNNDACRQILTLVENDPAMIKGVLKRESALGQVLNPIIPTSISFFGKGCE